MTYKKIVEFEIEQDARKWVEEVISESGYEEVYGKPYVFIDSIELENDKRCDIVFWTVKADVRFESNMLRRHLEVGGTADDLCGICHSVIWDAAHDILWMSVKSTREALGIDTFKFS